MVPVKRKKQRIRLKKDRRPKTKVEKAKANKVVKVNKVVKANKVVKVNKVVKETNNVDLLPSNSILTTSATLLPIGVCEKISLNAL